MEMLILFLIVVALFLVLVFLIKKKKGLKIVIVRSQKYLDECLVKTCLQFDEDNRKADINELIKLLEKGANPNQWVKVEEYESSYDPDGICSPDLVTYRYSLLSRCKNQAVKELLLAYGAKTTEELSAADAVREKEEEAEKERLRRIVKAEQKAKAENDLKNVKSFLSSKSSRA